MVTPKTYSNKVYSLKDVSIHTLLKSGLEYLIKHYNEKLFSPSPLQPEKDTTIHREQYNSRSEKSNTSFSTPVSTRPAVPSSTVRNKRLFHRLSVGEDSIRSLTAATLDQCIPQLRVLPLHQLIQIRLIQPDMREVPDSLLTHARFLNEVDQSIYRQLVDLKLSYNANAHDPLCTEYKYKPTPPGSLVDRAKQRLGREVVLVFGLTSFLKEMENLNKETRNKKRNSVQDSTMTDAATLFSTNVNCNNHDSRNAWWRIVAEVSFNKTNRKKNVVPTSQSEAHVKDDVSYIEKNPSMLSPPNIPSNQYLMMNNLKGHCDSSSKRRSGRLLEPPLSITPAKPHVFSSMSSMFERHMTKNASNHCIQAETNEKKNILNNNLAERIARGRRSLEIARSQSVDAVRRTLEEKSGKKLVDVFVGLKDFQLTSQRPSPEDMPIIYLYQNTDWIKCQVIAAGPGSAQLASSVLSCDILTVDATIPSFSQFLRPSDATCAIRAELNDKVKSLRSVSMMPTPQRTGVLKNTIKPLENAEFLQPRKIYSGPVLSPHQASNPPLLSNLYPKQLGSHLSLNPLLPLSHPDPSPNTKKDDEKAMIPFNISIKRPPSTADLTKKSLSLQIRQVEVREENVICSTPRSKHIKELSVLTKKLKKISKREQQASLPCYEQRHCCDISDSETPNIDQSSIKPKTFNATTNNGVLAPKSFRNPQETISELSASSIKTNSQGCLGQGIFLWNPIADTLAEKNPFNFFANTGSKDAIEPHHHTSVALHQNTLPIQPLAEHGTILSSSMNIKIEANSQNHHQQLPPPPIPLLTGIKQWPFVPSSPLKDSSCCSHKSRQCRIEADPDMINNNNNDNDNYQGSSVKLRRQQFELLSRRCQIEQEHYKEQQRLIGCTTKINNHDCSPKNMIDTPVSFLSSASMFPIHYPLSRNTDYIASFGTTRTSSSKQQEGPEDYQTQQAELQDGDFFSNNTDIEKQTKDKNKLHQLNNQVEKIKQCSSENLHYSSSKHRKRSSSSSSSSSRLSRASLASSSSSTRSFSSALSTTNSMLQLPHTASTVPAPRTCPEQQTAPILQTAQSAPLCSSKASLSASSSLHFRFTKSPLYREDSKSSLSQRSCYTTPRIQKGFMSWTSTRQYQRTALEQQAQCCYTPDTTDQTRDSAATTTMTLSPLKTISLSTQEYLKYLTVLREPTEIKKNNFLCQPYRANSFR